MNSPRSQWPLLIVALLLFAGAGWWWIRGRSGNGDRVYFYDLSAKKLFTVPRTTVPPIPGIEGPEMDGVRAVVISTNGNPKDPSARRVAYLEMYSPELKQQMEAAQAGGPPPAMGRAAAQDQRFVRRVDSPQWYPMSSPEAEQIVGEWLTAGPGGGPALICNP